jgi:hypothetical protein
MSGLQGKTTLTQDEMLTEARGHVRTLAPLVDEMEDAERDFVNRLAPYFRSTPRPFEITVKQLFWLRDLRAKY